MLVASGTWETYDESTLEYLWQTGDAGQRRRVEQERQRRRENLREFIRGLDDQDLEELVDADYHYTPSRYLGRAIDAGVESVELNRLVEAASDEQARRQRERQAARERQKPTPFRVVEL